jgi:hypothetical protein
VFIGFVNSITISLFGTTVLSQLIGFVDNTTGADLSIQVTVAVVSHVFQAQSINSKVKFQFHVKVYQVDHPLFVTVINSLFNHVSVAITSYGTFVHHPGFAGLYSIVAVGMVVMSYHSIANQ